MRMGICFVMRKDEIEIIFLNFCSCRIRKKHHFKIASRAFIIPMYGRRIEKKSSGSSIPPLQVEVVREIHKSFDFQSAGVRRLRLRNFLKEYLINTATLKDTKEFTDNRLVRI